MTSTRRPRFIHATLLLRDALGRFIGLRVPKAPKTARRRPRPRFGLPVFAQLVLFWDAFSVRVAAPSMIISMVYAWECPAIDHIERQPTRVLISPKHQRCNESRLNGNCRQNPMMIP
jgi:hypothetical protein